MSVDPAQTVHHATYGGEEYHFCSAGCRSKFIGEALAAYESSSDYTGIGFVFRESDPYCGVDLDECLDENGNWLWGEDLVRWLRSYSEVSPSGRGVKLILRAKKRQYAPCVKRGMADDGTGAIEIYDRGRFFAITGQVLEHSPVEVADCQDRLDALCNFLWPRRAERQTVSMTRRPINNDQIEARAIAYLESMPVAISGQGGHNATYAAATALVHGIGVPADRALQILQQHYNPRCEPPWSDKELRHKVDDAACKPHDRPVGWLRDEAQFVDIDDSDVDLSQFLSAMTKADGKTNVEPDRARALVTRLSDVECVPLQWLWPGRIPLGKLTLLAGDPDFASRS
jgi:YHS domain-containing protein